ncbi:MAG: polyprenyl synthetase family protein, partial [Acidobacteriota bacterium]
PPGAGRATEVVSIFRRKTAPAFEIALRLGAAAAGATDALHGTLKTYSDALGVAYQIRDDLGELREARDAGEPPELRPTLVWALAREAAKKAEKARVTELWTGERREPAEDIHRLLQELGAEQRADELRQAYEDEAIRSLRLLENANVKGLLRRVLGKIFDELQIEGWCSEHETRNAAGRQVGAAAAG